MAVNTQKLLPASKGSSIVRAKTTKISAEKISVGRDTSSSEKFNTIKTKLIDINKVLKGTVALDKKELDDKKISKSCYLNILKVRHSTPENPVIVYFS